MPDAEVRRCEDDRCWPEWGEINPWPYCGQCRQPVYHDGTTWRHIDRG